MAEQAAKIGASPRYTFERDADGSPSETLASGGGPTWKCLEAWFAL